MFGSFVVEMVVGLLATFALLGLCVTTLTEVLQTYVRSIRSTNLEQCLKQLFTLGEAGKGQDFFEKLLAHPLIESMSAPGRKPSYLQTSLIVDAVIDELVNATSATAMQAGQLMEEIELGVAAIKSTPLGRLLNLFLSKSQAFASTPEQALKMFKANIEHWLEAGMERAEGSTRRQAKSVSLIVAGMLCAALNVNAIDLAHTLATDSVLRRNLYEQVQQNPQPDTKSIADECAKGPQWVQCRFEKVHEVIPSALQIGWERPPAFYSATSGIQRGLWFAYWLVGVAVAALAASMGGDYWYKLLSSIIRLTGPRPANAANFRIKKRL